MLRVIYRDRDGYNLSAERRGIETISMKMGYFLIQYPLHLSVVRMGRYGHHAFAKTALLIIAATCLVSAGYSSTTGMPPDEARIAEPLEGTAWELTQFRADNGSVIAPLPGTAPLIAFGEDGTLSGSAGWDLYSASYRISGSTITVESGAVTLPRPAVTQDLARQESRYRELLVAAASYRVEDDRLILSGPSGRDLLTFSRAESPETGPLLSAE